jgi:hypothetical protein
MEDSEKILDKLKQKFEELSSKRAYFEGIVISDIRERKILDRTTLNNIFAISYAIQTLEDILGIES